MAESAGTYSGPGPQDVYLEPRELSSRWRGRPTTCTLSNWRAQGRGPDFVKLGNRVLYPLSAVRAFEEAHRTAAARERPR